MRPSWEMIPRLVDYDIVYQVASEIVPHMYFTTSMYRQVIPELADDMIPPGNDDDIRKVIAEEPEN